MTGRPVTAGCTVGIRGQGRHYIQVHTLYNYAKITRNIFVNIRQYLPVSSDASTVNDG